MPRHAISGTGHKGAGGNAMDLKLPCSSGWNPAEGQSQYWVPALGYIAMFITKSLSFVFPKLWKTGSPPLLLKWRVKDFFHKFSN